MAALDQRLLDHGRMGLISLDSSHRIKMCVGELVSDLTEGSIASETLPVLTGWTRFSTTLPADDRRN